MPYAQYIDQSTANLSANTVVHTMHSLLVYFDICSVFILYNNFVYYIHQIQMDIFITHRSIQTEKKVT